MTSLIARSLDLRGHAAPLARAAVSMLEVEPGELVEVLTEDPAAVRDFAVWCRATGNQLVTLTQEGTTHHLVIRRR
ncbi:MAG TPA: sulfurtransferase TusA family protein [Actinomycetes bacterium]|jgi:tRNA 2-thiouridine synthesizing protein A|nr:sulfurtransferase TusA family protein [Actinomycetes bacterium]